MVRKDISLRAYGGYRTRLEVGRPDLLTGSFDRGIQKARCFHASDWNGISIQLACLLPYNMKIKTSHQRNEFN